MAITIHDGAGIDRVIATRDVGGVHYQLLITDPMDTPLITLVNVGSSAAAALPTTPLTDRRFLLVQNLSSVIVWIGFSSGVTASNGIRLPPGGDFHGEYGPSVTVYGRAASGTTNDVRVFEAA